MKPKYNTLIDRLHTIVDEVHIEEVKDIIATLLKIDNFKHTIEEDLSTKIIYKKVKYELKNEFNIENFKIVLSSNKVNTTLFKNGKKVAQSYTFHKKVANKNNISIVVEDNQLSKYQKLTLNSYFSELVQLLYIQYVLDDLQKTATVDPLTNLENRISFNTEMKTLIPLAIREKMKIGALLINIDRFRAVNDEHGDDFGDDFLKLYADTIKENIRSSDIAVRFAGGVFLVLLVNIDSELRTITIANKLREKLANSFLISPNGDRFQKTVCIGVSMFPDDSSDIQEIVKNTEVALSDGRDKERNKVFRFKSDEKNTIEFF